MTDKILERIINDIRNDYPFLSNHEISQIIINEMLDNIDTIMNKITLPDPNQLRVQRNFKMKRRKKSHREFQTDKYKEQNILYNAFTKLKNQSESNELDGETTEVKVFQSDKNALIALEFSGASIDEPIDNLIRSDYEEYEAGKQNKWIDNINQDIIDSLSKKHRNMFKEIEGIIKYKS